MSGFHRHAPRVQTKPVGQPGPEIVPPIVHAVLRSPGRALDVETRAFFESRLGYDFSDVRVHTNAKAAESARAVHALAYTMGRHVVFGTGQYAPAMPAGMRTLAHELTHVVQQGPSSRTGGTRPLPASVATIRRRPAPYIKKVAVHLTPKQSADLEWEGSAPTDAPGSDHFTVSTGKGYGDPGDPAGTCTRSCCKDAMTQCAPPWNRPEKVGACCTYYGDSYWTGTPLVEHNGWKWWTPIQPYYSSRGIALHQHTDVTGEPIGHGCVRMDDDNAKRIHDFSNGRRTKVAIDGRAAPVACEDDRKCAASSGGAGLGAGVEGVADEEGLASFVIPGLEGVMT